MQKINILFPFVWKLMKSGAYNTFFTNSAIEYCYQWKRCNRHVMISSIEVVNHCQINIINIMCMWAWGVPIYVCPFLSFHQRHNPMRSVMSSNKYYVFLDYIVSNQNSDRFSFTLDKYDSWDEFIKSRHFLS